MSRLLWFVIGFLSAVVVGALLFYVRFINRPPGAIQTKSEVIISERAIPVNDRIHTVVSDWSGTSTFAESDQLTDIWNLTRNTAHHDFPFEKGGSDGLSKMLNTEFKHVPKANITVTAQNFPPSGNVKTVAQLISSYNGHVPSR